MELVLWLICGLPGLMYSIWLLVMPGLMYSIWRLASRYSGCASCASPDLISLDSPGGRQLLERLKPNG